MEERIIEPPTIFSLRPGSVLGLSEIFKNTELIASLTRREVRAQYRTSWLGFCWPVLQPLLMLAVYTFVFSVVFGARWPGVYESDLVGYAVVVFSGLLTFNIFSESVRACPKLIAANSSFVQRVVFPLEVLPVVKVAAAVFDAIAGLTVLMVFLLVSGASIPWTVIYLPLVWLGFAAFSLGICYAVATLSVFVPDLEPLIGIGVMGLFFGSAIFYPLERLPDTIESWVRLLPTATAVDLTRSLLLLGEAPSLWSLLGPGLISVLSLYLGYAGFVAAKRSFADAL